MSEVYLSFALDRKYSNAAKEWKWRNVFPAARVSCDPHSDAVRYHHIDGIEHTARAGYRNPQEGDAADLVT